MPSSTRSSWFRRLIVLVAMLGLVATACGNSDDNGDSSAGSSTKATTGGGSGSDAPGVTSDEIRFSVIGTKSNNPLGTCVLDCYVDGIKAYFAYRNSQGGVHGHKLVVTKELDDQLAQNQVKALEVITANDTFATFSAAQIASGWGDLAEAGIPLYVWMINPADMAGKDSIWGNREVVCITCTKRYETYAAGLAKAKKVASLGYGVSENSQQCAKAASDGIDKYGKEVGAESAYLNDDLAFGLPNGIGPEVTAMKKAGVDFVIGCIDLNGMKTLAEELKRQGMDDVTLYNTNTYDQSFVKENADLFEGDIVMVSFRPFEAKPNAALAAYKKWMKETGSELTELAITGWLNADLAYRGIKAAGSDFDRQKVIDATNKLTAYTADGLLAPIDWTRQHEAPTEEDPATHGPKYDCASFVRIKDGTFHVVGDRDKPFLCWPGETRDWSEPELMTFK